VVDNLGLLDWEGVQEDLLDGVDLACLDKSAKLSAGNPLLVVIPTAPTSTAAAITTTSAAATVSAATTITAAPAICIVKKRVV
jgi:hypothetical protein